jgi:hypothetical protein
MNKITWLLACLGVVALIDTRPAAQGGITVTFPSTLAAGPDYATDVLGDPWDMTSLNDISIDPQQRAHWTGVAAINDTGNGATPAGVANAVGGAFNGNEGLSFLYKGHYGVIDNVRNGSRYPIDTSRFKRISFKMRTGPTGSNPPAVIFSHRPYSHPSGEGNGSAFDFWANNGSYQVFTTDLTNPDACHTSCVGGEAWSSSPVVGLRIDPALGGTNQNVFYDWVRLTLSDSDATKQTISWSGSGSGNSTITVTDSGGTVFTVATVSGTSYAWNYGILPPGDYTLTVTRTGANGTKNFHINHPPLITVTDPDETGGQDFATTVLSNPWDMSDTADVDNNVSGIFDHLVQRDFTAGEFVGRSDGVQVPAGSQVGDPQVYMVANPNSTGSSPQGTIDTSRYRFLSFKLKIDRAFSLGLGSVGRVFWGSTTQYNLAVSQSFIVWPEYNTYTVDLAALTVGGDGGIEPGSPSPTVWTASPTRRQLRIDPHEFPEQVVFHLDDVKLAAMDESNGSFIVRFNASDADGGTPNVTLFYDTDKDPNNGKTQFAALSGSAVTSEQYAWDTDPVPSGAYWVYAQVSDGTDTRGSYSTGQVQINSPLPPPEGDEVMFDLGANGLWVLYNNAITPYDGERGLRQLHAANPGPMAMANLDGNATRDLIVDFPGGGIWIWMNNANWVPLHDANAAAIVVADMDNNGIDEIVISFPGAGVWVRRNNSSWDPQLHLANPARMAAGDMDGNGRADVIFDFPPHGLWVRKNDNVWESLHPASGSSIVFADLDGNGSDEVLVAFPGAGLWVYRNGVSWESVALHTVTPSRMIAADVDGNGRDDVVIDFPGYGLWIRLNDSSWPFIHPASAEGFAVADMDNSGQDDVAIDFGGSGVWVWMNNTFYRLVQSQNPTGMAGGNIDGL